MATLSDSTTDSHGQRRRKPLTYGRSARNKTFTPQSVGAFFDQIEHPHGPVQSTTKIPSKLKTLTKPSRSTRPPPGDEFDVPFSDDETDRHLITPSAPHRDEFDVPLSDSEAETTHHPHNSQANDRSTTILSSRTRKKIPVRSLEDKQKEQKRKSRDYASPSQKRTRTSSPASPPLTVMQSHAVDNLAQIAAADDGFANTVSPPDLTDQSNVRRSRRNVANTTALSRGPPQKGISAPARLHHMVSESSFDDSAPSSIHPARLESTESRQSIISEDSSDLTPRRPATLRRATSTTPKQSQLWSQLLSSDPVEPDFEASTDPSPYAFNKQTRYHASQPQSSCSNRPAVIESSAQRQGRLVDRLKQASQAHQFSDDLEDDDDDELSQENVDEDVSALNVPTTPRTATQMYSQEAHLAESPPQQTESQSLNSQSRLTYSSTRTYLLEDNLEDNLMFALPTAEASIPVPSVRRVKNGKQAKNATFDLDGDSDEGNATGIRSIHELRAAGNKNRFLDDNAVLFDDIKDHKTTSRSRRCGALIELATKLSNKTFLTRFVEHGFDRELAAELSVSTSDPISDAALCAILSRLSAIEAGHKSLAVLFQAGALSVAARCLAETRSASQVAKDRRNNMSKVAQSTFLEFMESLRLSNLWGEQTPEALTIQLLGLKCMELTVLRLRRQGNQSDILGPEEINRLVHFATDPDDSAKTAQPTSSKVVARSTALSVLEFASTSKALVDTWSPELWSRVVSALPAMLCLEKRSQALVLRICINLTNGNARNCELCSNGSVVEAIFRQIVDGFCHLYDLTDDEDYKSRLDSLILSLGLMINLAEFSDAACEEAAALEKDGLALLVGTFLRGQDKVEHAQSEEETRSNVAYGFLAVMLGNLCQNYKARKLVQACLPGGKLQTLSASIDEFAQLNRKVDSQAYENEEARAIWTHVTDKLMAAVARLQELEE